MARCAKKDILLFLFLVTIFHSYGLSRQSTKPHVAFLAKSPRLLPKAEALP